MLYDKPYISESQQASVGIVAISGDSDCNVRLAITDKRLFEADNDHLDNHKLVSIRDWLLPSGLTSLKVITREYFARLLAEKGFYNGDANVPFAISGTYLLSLLSLVAGQSLDQPDELLPLVEAGTYEPADLHMANMIRLASDALPIHHTGFQKLDLFMTGPAGAVVVPGIGSSGEVNVMTDFGIYNYGQSKLGATFRSWDVDVRLADGQVKQESQVALSRRNTILTQVGIFGQSNSIEIVGIPGSMIFALEGEVTTQNLNEIASYLGINGAPYFIQLFGKGRVQSQIFKSFPGEDIRGKQDNPVMHLIDNYMEQLSWVGNIEGGGPCVQRSPYASKGHIHMVNGGHMNRLHIGTEARSDDFLLVRFSWFPEFTGWKCKWIEATYMPQKRVK